MRARSILLATAALISCGAAAAPCDDAPARVYLQTGAVLETEGEASLLLRVRGGTADDPGRPQQFAFAHGTVQGDIIVAINAFAPLTQVEAWPSRSNPARIELRSLAGGGDAFIAVEQLSLPKPRVYEEAAGGAGAFALTQHGWSAIAADLNCDGEVNAPDLLILLGHWGPCGASCPGDLNRSGAVDVRDLLIVLGNWGG